MKEKMNDLKVHIISTAKTSWNNTFSSKEKNWQLDCLDIKYSLGTSTIYASFKGGKELHNDGLYISGRIMFRFYDAFKDPADLGNWRQEDWEVPTGTPYDIVDKWEGSFQGVIHPKIEKSYYK